MQIKKISEEVRYRISDHIINNIYSIHVTVTNGEALYIANHMGRGEFNFIDSKPEVVAAVGRMLIAASELVSDMTKQNIVSNDTTKECF